MPFKLFQNGNILTAQEVQEFLMNQQVMVFENAGARDSSITNPTEGMFAFILENERLTVYKNSAWRNL
jgi:spore maturation protein CgeB